jgi:hypothetical protein
MTKTPNAYSYIRMSTDLQLKGDSLRRQLEKSDAYAAAHGLELVHEYEDIGVSAFKGDNLAEVGCAWAFLGSCKDRENPRRLLSDR